MRRRRLPQLPPPPPAGYTWLHQQLILTFVVELFSQNVMEAFDRTPRRFNGEHWRNDPSYDWVAQTKRKKGPR
jgi:hypothetical protein